jgi:uncharacterized protein (DUF1015 family)
MRLVRPVATRVVTSQWAARVVSPLHDVLTDDERRAMLADNPDSYLHVTSDPLALPPALGEGPAETAQARALQRLLDQGAYRCVPEPSVFVYRMREEGRAHTGVVAGLDLTGFADGRVLGHERVQEERVERLIRHYEAVDFRSELVALFHRAEPAVAELTTRVCEDPPLLDFTDALGVEQSVWQAGPEESTALARHLARSRHYIADGHHRVAAALRRWRNSSRSMRSTAGSAGRWPPRTCSTRSSPASTCAERPRRSCTRDRSVCTPHAGGTCSPRADSAACPESQGWT